MKEKRTIFDVLSEAHSIAARTEYRLANAAFEIQSVMDDMAAKGIIKALKSECDLEITM